VTKNLEKLRAPIRPDRIRRIGNDGFAFVPHRFLRDGFLASLQHDELALYLFLLLAGNRDGVSFYRYDAICSILHLTLDDYIAVRDGLIARDLIAFDGNRYQVLSLPAAPATTPTNVIDPATVRAAILANVDSDE
jgi:hypothetical protein